MKSSAPLLILAFLAYVPVARPDSISVSVIAPRGSSVSVRFNGGASGPGTAMSPSGGSLPTDVNSGPTSYSPAGYLPGLPGPIQQGIIQQNAAPQIQRAIQQSIVNDAIKDQIQQIRNERMAEQKAVQNQLIERAAQAAQERKDILQEQKAEDDQNTTAAQERLMARQLAAVMSSPVEGDAQLSNPKTTGAAPITPAAQEKSANAGLNEGGQGEAALESGQPSNDSPSTQTEPGSKTDSSSHAWPWLIAGLTTLVAIRRTQKGSRATQEGFYQEGGLIPLPRNFTGSSSREVKS